MRGVYFGDGISGEVSLVVIVIFSCGQSLEGLVDGDGRGIDRTMSSVGHTKTVSCEFKDFISCC